MKTFRKMFGVLLIGFLTVALFTACSDDDDDNDNSVYIPTMIQRFTGKDSQGGTIDRIDVFDDGTYQYFQIFNGEFVMYAKGVYSGNPTAEGTVVIALSQYLRNGEWVSAPANFPPCNVKLFDDKKGLLWISNWDEVVEWYRRLWIQ